MTDSDGVALQSAPHPFEISEAMLDAGEKAYQHAMSGDMSGCPT